MPGSATTPDRPGARAIAPVRVAFHGRNCVGIRDDKSFAAQWLAYALPYRRFADILANARARLGANVDRYSFTERDLHPLLLAGFAGALREPSQEKRPPTARHTNGRFASGSAPDLLLKAGIPYEHIQGPEQSSRCVLWLSNIRHFAAMMPLDDAVSVAGRAPEVHYYDGRIIFSEAQPKTSITNAC
jgi:hypothetical protein